MNIVSRKFVRQTLSLARISLFSVMQKIAQLNTNRGICDFNTRDSLTNMLFSVHFGFTGIILRKSMRISTQIKINTKKEPSSIYFAFIDNSTPP